MKAGQAVWGKITFLNGTQPAYNRPYLIVSSGETESEVMDISSVKGKEWKLAFPSNYAIKDYNPPFAKPSFAKLDSLRSIPNSELDGMRLMSGQLDENELKEIQRRIKEMKGDD